MMRVSGTEKVLAKLQSAFDTAKDLSATRTKLLKDIKEATPVRTGHARDGWRIEGDAIVNDVPYIKELNGGSSAQAPEYFIEKTLLAEPTVRPNGTIAVYR